MSKKGYGNVNPRFAKYFARHKNSSGPHDPKNARQQALQEAQDRFMDEDYDAPPEEIFDTNERVRVTSGEYEGEYGRIVVRRMDKGDMSYGLVFDWDTSMIIHYVSGNQIERER